MRNFVKALTLGLGVFVLAACGNGNGDEAADATDYEAATGERVVNVYSSRHYDTDRDLFRQFEEETGITVNLIEGTTVELLERVHRESNNPQADLFIDVGATALYEMLSYELIQDHGSDIGADLDEGMAGDSWLAVANRARAVVYDLEGTHISIDSYMDLISDEFYGEILARSSTHIYNIALMAGIIQFYGEDAARDFAQGIADNLAREPYGNDRDQARAMVAGEGAVALKSTYYIQMMRVSADENDVYVGTRLGAAFPQETFVDISWMGVLNGAENAEYAVKLMEFMLTEEAQTKLMFYNGELPVHTGVTILEEVKNLYDFNRMEINYEYLGRYMRMAMMMMDEAGWR